MHQLHDDHLLLATSVVWVTSYGRYCLYYPNRGYNNDCIFFLRLFPYYSRSISLWLRAASDLSLASLVVSSWLFWYSRKVFTYWSFVTCICPRIYPSFTLSKAVYTQPLPQLCSVWMPVDNYNSKNLGNAVPAYHHSKPQVHSNI